MGESESVLSAFEIWKQIEPFRLHPHRNVLL